MKRAALLLVGALCLSGCGAGLIGVLAEIASYVANAAEIVDILAGDATEWFSEHPDPAAEAKVDQAVRDLRLALAALSALDQGGQAASQQDIAKAFDDAKTAYENLIALLQDVGALKAGRMMAYPGEPPAPPDPAFMHYRAP